MLMLDYTVTLTNDEARALDDVFDRMDATLSKRLTAPTSKPHDRTAIAYNALRKVWKPLRQHVTRLIHQRRRK
jgi:hypothetical protein